MMSGAVALFPQYPRQLPGELTMRLTTHQMARLAEEMNRASQEIDVALSPDVPVNRMAPQLSTHLQSLAVHLSAVQHSA